MKIIVVGGGHAGVETAYAAAKMGADVTLLTMQLESIAHMPCNPSIGGVAKGHLVKEIDALAGIMPRASDETGIHFKTLNCSKGPAVRASRAQIDKADYRVYVKSLLENTPRITLYQSQVTQLLIKNQSIIGLKTLEGDTLKADAVVITSGTFLNGKIFLGDISYLAGRANEMPAIALAKNLKELGFKTIRLKTGTPMRLHADTIDWSKFIPQPGDEPPLPFSIYTRKNIRNRILCYLGHTPKTVKEFILDNIHLSPLYSGKIKGIGPRYCPSIEDKMIKFPNKESHHFFLEPEGINTKEVYVNGLSTSLPLHIQKKLLSLIPGLENAQMIRPAYAVEYDAIISTQLFHSLESRIVKNLFFAGQINGTSGYEEAAAQGIMAGINATLTLRNAPPFVLQRHEAYIGVLIDDLITLGVDEPYRLFTARAEYRLLLREDNAFERLGMHAWKYKLVTRSVHHKQIKKMETRNALIEKLKTIKISIQNQRCTLFQLLKRPEYTLEKIPKETIDLSNAYLPSDLSYVEAVIKYSGYLEIQKKEIEKNLKRDQIPIPFNTNFDHIPGISIEIRQKLSRYRPSHIGEARKITGMTPAAINALSIYLTIQKKSRR